MTTYAIAMDSVKNGNMTFSPKNAVKGTIVIKLFIPELIGKDIYITDMGESLILCKPQIELQNDNII